MKHPHLRLDHFEPTRAAGLERLAAFLPFAGSHYAKHRNTDYGTADQVGVSGLSPYLRYRLLTEAEVIAAVLEEHSLEATQKFIQEVVWRTYWKGWLEMRPSVWSDYLAEVALSRQALVNDPAKHRVYESAVAGRTGIEGFDDWARLLVETGYLHNHARMWFASIWIFTLELPWALGADFFLTHLIDGDPASNTLSWRWVAGIQTKGKTYLATRENIERFTEGRYAPAGLATFARPIHSTEPPKPKALVEQPTVLTALDQPSVLLVHPDDLSIAIHFRDHPMVQRVVWLRGQDEPEAYPWARKAQWFVETSIESLRQSDDVVLEGVIVESLERCLKESGTHQIVTVSPPVGPLADVIHRCALSFDGRWIECRQPYDRLLWPLATKGFFPFKEQLFGPDPLIKTIVDMVQG